MVFRRWRRTSTAAPLVVVLAAITLIGSGCGSSSKPTKQLLRSEVPLTSGLYVQLKGPAGAVNRVANAIESGAFTKVKTGAVPPYGDGGSFVPPRVQQRRVCLFARTIQPTDSPQLQPWRGKKITFTIYGERSSSSILFCRLIAIGVLPAH
jgi:hypothetical protein